MLFVIFALAATAAQPAVQNCAPTGRLSGRVVIAGTSTPVAGAQITVVPILSGPPPAPRTMPPPQPPTRVTDEEGRFTFEHLRPGRYRINVQKSGFASDVPMLGAAPRAPIDIVAGQPLDVGDIAIERGGAIAGRVLDARGEPVADVRVMALRRLPRGRGANGPPMIPIGQPNQSNDLGEFRIFGLPAGDYTIVAVPQSRFGTPADASAVAATTYFPGTADIEAATPVSVTASQSTNGIELRLVSVPAYRVSGITVDSVGNPVAGAMVMLMPDRRQVIPFLGAVAGSVRSGPNGAFTIGGVPTGTYRASATAPFENASGGTVRGFVGGVGGPDVGTEVIVGDGNVTGVRIVVQGR